MEQEYQQKTQQLNEEQNQQIYEQPSQTYNQANTQQQYVPVDEQPYAPTHEQPYSPTQEQYMPIQNQQQMYIQYQQYYQPYAPKKRNGKAIASLVLSIVSLVNVLLFWVFPYNIIGLITGIIGLVLGISANKEQKTGMGTAGIIMSCIGLSISAVELIACFACISACTYLFAGY